MAKGRTGLAAVAVVAAFVACPFAALAQTWSAGPPVPAPRALLGAATVGNMVYAIGGTIPVAANIPTNKVEALDTTTGSWSTKAPLPQPISAPAVVAVDGKVYALGGAPEGGGHPWNTVYVYDPVANSWSTGTPMPTGRVLHSAAVLDRKIYIIGGADPASNFLTAVDVYDPADDSWSSAAPTPTFRLFGGAASLDGLIYYVGGFNLGPPMDQGIIVYDPGTDSWTARNAKFADTRAGLGLAVLGGALYAVSGQNDFAQVFADVFKYDPVADAWLPGPPIPHARSAFGYAVAGASLYAISGLSSIDVGFLGDSVDVLTSSSDDTAPQTSAAATPAPNAAGWNNSDVTVKLTATDEAGGSGVKFISYKVEGPVSFDGLENDASVTIVLSAEGTSTIRFLAGDNAGNFESEKRIVVKIDKTGPGATLALSPGVLWPPNHRMVSITPSLSASDTGGMPVTLSRIAVSSNESQSAAGDWTVNNAILQLRAARDGRGSGRVYTVTYTLTDIAGNATEVTATVTVPHDRGR